MGEVCHRRDWSGNGLEYVSRENASRFISIYFKKATIGEGDKSEILSER